ncbi:GNAT family N-acetyltransferase [Streptomyces yangpuensis]|uniref:GNAT family N-acetyltransferase n=1 Tax=Streptomyces yangpuensis TaxID=1648182 RepID=UPI003714E8C1
MEQDGKRLGFYAFTEEGDGLLLDKLFVDADEIGKGYGRLLWEHAVQTARELGRSEFIVASDPNAAPFYAAMDAVQYATKPTAEPSWTLHMFRYTLSEQAGGRAGRREDRKAHFHAAAGHLALRPGEFAHDAVGVAGVCDGVGLLGPEDVEPRGDRVSVGRDVTEGECAAGVGVGAGVLEGRRPGGSCSR